MSEPTDEDMIKKPLTGKDFKASSGSAHAFYTKDLGSPCHPGAGVDPVYHSGLLTGGTIRLRCHECKQLLGVVLVAQDIEG